MTAPSPRFSPGAIARRWLPLALAAVALAGLATNWWGWESGFSILLGVGLGAANFGALSALTARLLAAEGPAGRAAVLLALKLAALVCGVYALIHWTPALPLPLALGFALVPLAWSARVALAPAERAKDLAADPPARPVNKTNA